MRYSSFILSVVLAAVMVLPPSIVSAAPGPPPKPGKQISQSSRMSIRSRRAASSRRASNPRRPTKAQIQRSSQRVDSARAGGRAKVSAANARRRSVERGQRAKRISTSSGRPLSSASMHLPHDAYHVVQQRTVDRPSSVTSLQRLSISAFASPPFYVRVNEALIRLDAPSGH